MEDTAALNTDKLLPKTSDGHVSLVTYISYILSQNQTLYIKVDLKIFQSLFNKEGTFFLTYMFTLLAGFFENSNIHNYSRDVASRNTLEVDVEYLMYS
jgi:hypothetical protein